MEYSLVILGDHRIVVARSLCLCCYPFTTFPDYLSTTFQHLHIFRIILLQLYTELSSHITHFMLELSLRKECESIIVSAGHKVE